MAKKKPLAVLPQRQESQFRSAYEAFQTALRSDDDWATRKLAATVQAAEAAGWSRRSIAAGLGISRERTQKLATCEADSLPEVGAYSPGREFPMEAIAAYRAAEAQVGRRRAKAERKFTAILRAAHGAGWSYPRLGELVDISGERLRQIAEADVDTDGVPVPAFEPYPSPARQQTESKRGKLSKEEREHLRTLAAVARNARKNLGKQLPPEPAPEDLENLEEALRIRKASEELSALIIDAKKRKVTWPDLDEACGYQRGGSRARATRHGYGKLSPTMKKYTPTAAEIYQKVDLEPPVRPASD